jgi:hypothetical protein
MIVWSTGNVFNSAVALKTVLLLDELHGLWCWRSLNQKNSQPAGSFSRN